jgi:glycerol-3-phosphate dehydrogenase
MAGRNVDAAGFEMARKKLERALDAGQRWSIFDYEDAQCEFPERLVAEWLVEAIAAGAVVRNHSQVMAVDVAHGRARGLLVRDWTRNLEEKIEATWIVNATGPWVDRTCGRSGIKMRRPLVSGVRGSHIVLSHFPGAPSTAVYTEGADGRPLYIIPWNEQLLVGATHVPDTSDPGKVHPASDEIESLLHSLASLFPKARISQNDIRYSFAGIRNLPFDPSGDPGTVSRQHSIHDHQQENVARLISVIGGNLATAISVARDCRSRWRSRMAPLSIPCSIILWWMSRALPASAKRPRVQSWSGTASAPWRLRAWRKAARNCAPRSAPTPNISSRKRSRLTATNAPSRWATCCCAACRSL